MRPDELNLDDAERITLTLRSLYQRHGYARFRMKKFEEYDLYAQNKDFLISEQVITFTDTDGKLMALKPDVTLSVIKYLRDEPDRLQKLCYNENVYRVSRGTGSFRELMQVGVECVGQVDRRCVGEVLLLAAESLSLCTTSYVLELSQLEIITKLLDDAFGISPQRAAALKCMKEKNIAGAAALCRTVGAGSGATEALLALMRLSGSPARILPELRALCASSGLDTPLSELETAVADLEAGGFLEHVTLDFSSVGNMTYYNGICFHGFVEGAPESVLSGGQYDKLMRKMGRASRAIGFAVYLDRLERISERNTDGGGSEDA